MKTNIVMLAAVLSASLVYGQGLTPAGKARMPEKDKQTKELTPEEIAQNHAKAEALRKSIAYKGGWVSVPVAGPAIKLIDATSKGWAMEGLQGVKVNLDRFDLCPSMTERKALAGDAIAEGRAAAKDASGVVMLVDSAEDAPLVTAYPEERLALVNMTALSKGVSSGVRQDRVEKLTWRAIGHLVGCGAPDGYTCVMKPLRNMADLDAMPNKFIHPASFFKARPYFDMCGVTPARKGTYEAACQQGWAPAPTNDVQRAILERVKAEQREKPSNPIRILPGQKPSGK